MSLVFPILAKIGALTLALLAQIGAWANFSSRLLWALVTPPWYPRIFCTQFRLIGYESLAVVGLTAIFSGMVLALQSYTGFSRFSAEMVIPQVVVVSITRELGPVLAGLMVAGRVGAAMAAELGTMRVTEQVDALETLGVDPLRYLAAPRLVASLMALPLLVLCADIIGVMGGYFVGTQQLGFSPAAYLQQTWKFIEPWDVLSGLIKAAVFGFLIALFGCYQGFTARDGARGVGRATTTAVVSASIAILCSNYLITALFFAS